MRYMILFFLSICMPFTAQAAADKPAEIASLIQADAPIGKGRLSRMWLVGYDAELWTDAEKWSMQQPFALSLIYRMNFTSEEIVERTIEEMKRIPEVNEQMLKGYPEKLAKLFPNVKDGDRITAVYEPGKGTRFYHNHQPTGTIKDAAFEKNFFAIWLGPNTSEPALRQALLNQ